MVGRRRCDARPGSGMLLIVIRRQPMIFRADESLERTAQVFSGKLPEKIGSGQRSALLHGGARSRLIHQAMAGGGKPEDQEGAPATGELGPASKKSDKFAAAMATGGGIPPSSPKGGGKVRAALGEPAPLDGFPLQKVVCG